MFDFAKKILDEGSGIAADRIEGVNDNMHASHFHDFYELYFLESGSRYHMIESEMYLAQPGELLLFEPFVMHRSFGDPDMPFGRLLLYFAPEQIASSNLRAALEGSTGIYRLPQEATTSFYTLIDQILREQQRKNIFHAEAQNSLLNELLIQFFRSKALRQKNTEENPIADILSYIGMHYAEALTIEKLAQQFYISPYHLCRVFKRYTNTTVIRYINTIRILAAEKMLLSTAKSITEIGGAVGFDSSTHFGRVFKSITGVTPSAMRFEKRRAAPQR